MNGGRKMGGNSSFGDALTKGFDQLKQQSNPQAPPGKQQSMIPGFQYDPNKGLTVNLGNELLTQLMQSMQPKQGQPMAQRPPQIMQPQAMQPNNQFLQQNPMPPA